MRLWPMRTKRRNDELDEELRVHIAMAARAYEEQGAAPADAMNRARREFGNEHVVRERTREQHQDPLPDRLAVVCLGELVGRDRTFTLVEEFYITP